MTTIETLTTEQIRTLRTEARSAGDEKMAQICTEALQGSDSARETVAEAIRSAEAMQ